MARGECLAHDTAVVYRYGFICHGRQTLVTFVEYRDCTFVADLGTVFRIGVDLKLPIIKKKKKLARLRLATTERLFDRQANETKEHTEWHTITLWRGLADVVDRYVNKGSQIYIEGRLRTREWTDKDNNKRYTTEILADDMKLLGRRGDNQSAGAPAGGYAQPQGQPSYQQPAQPSYQQPAAQTPVTPAADDPDDLPF